MADDNAQELAPLPNMDNLPAVPREALDLSHAMKVPVSQITALGTAFAPIAQSLANMAKGTEGAGETLYRLYDAAGNLLSPEQLHQLKDGSAYIGSVKGGALSQARIKPVDPKEAISKATDVDPETLLIALALAQINQKLDSIATMQEAMFAYAKLRDHAKLVGAFKVLDELRENYRFNSTNDAYLASRHHLVAQAWRDAEDAIELHRGQLQAMLKPLSPIHLGADVKKRKTEMVEALRNYQLATYLYAYATLMDINLVANYDPAYLDSVAAKMERYSTEYFVLYGQCADRIEQDARSTLEAVATDGVGSLAGAVGRLVARTPVGDATRIDEALIERSEAMGSLVSGNASGAVSELALARPGFMRPFIDAVKDMRRLHAQPVILAATDGSVYALPCADTDTERTLHSADAGGAS